MTVTMVDFVSDMGNFAVDPETLTIGAPGQTARADADGLGSWA